MAEYYIIPLINGQPDIDSEVDSFRVMYPANDVLYCEFNGGIIRKSWQPITEDEFYKIVPREPAPEQEETQLDRIEREIFCKNDELRYQGEQQAAQKVAAALSIEYLADAEQIVAYTVRLQQAGAQAMQQLKELPVDAGLFKLAYPEWKPDGGTEERLAISVYKGMVYQCMVDTQRIAEYAPDKATNNYNPYPEPNADGVYPYVYGMGVVKGMRVREDGVVYRCILETDKPYKLIYPPSTVPAVFTAE